MDGVAIASTMFAHHVEVEPASFTMVHSCRITEKIVILLHKATEHVTKPMKASQASKGIFWGCCKE